MNKVKLLRFVGLVLAALTVGMKLAHTLELVPKLQWAPELYFPVQTTLYKAFAIFGPIVDFGAILTVAFLAASLRRDSAFRVTVAALVAMLLSVLVWATVVGPANGHINEWLVSQKAAEDWMVWRDRWQYGQAICFLFDFSGFVLLLFSVVRDTPDKKTS